jgi:asparagine synthase (glutamine-hydrolysing)
MARELGGQIKVVLQGDGGDELFGGYSRYFSLARYPLLHRLAAMAQYPQALTPRNAFHYRMRRYLRAMAAPDLATTMALLLTSEDLSLAPAKIFGAELRRLVEQQDPFRRHRAVLAELAGHDRVNQMSFMDLMITLPDTFLEKVDRATMACSLEVRVPLLDHDLVDFALSLPGVAKAPGGRRKYLLKCALEGIVPEQVLRLPKAGLEVPYGQWLQGALRGLFFDNLEHFGRRYPGVLDLNEIFRMHAATGCGGKDDSYMLWKILNFTIWANNSNVEIRV